MEPMGETISSPSVEEMGAPNVNETSGLVPSKSAKPIYINLINNTISIIFIILIGYLCFKDGSTLFSYHPLSMSIGFLVLMPMAVNSITPGDIISEWMPVKLRSWRHWIIMTLAAIAITTGFVVILTNKILANKSHFVSLHSIFGLTAIVCTSISLAGGISALFSLKLKRFIPPIYVRMLHAFAGLLTFILACISIIIGLFSQWFSFGDPVRYTCLCLVLTIVVLTVLRPSLKLYVRIRERVQI